MSTSTIAEMGAMVGDPGRANMLTALLDGRALTARELADRAGISPQTASGHLGKLLAAGMICMERQGRHHYHRLASDEVAQMLETMHVAGAQMKPKGPPRVTGPRDLEMRIARSCYDHLAGRLGVALADALGDDATTNSGGCLSRQGEAKLVNWGVDIASARGGKRAFCRPCIDWSERQPHLAGAIGAAMLERSLALGWVRRRDGVRSLVITPDGQRGFHSHFGVSIEP